MVDAVLFDPRTIDERGTIPYYRHKTRNYSQIQAMPVVPPRVTEVLRNVPVPEGWDPNQPFRTPGIDLASDCRKWEHRMLRLIHRAGITYVELKRKDADGRPVRRRADVKMLRHTCAIEMILVRAPLERVAKHLGHASTDTTRKAYVEWCAEVEAQYVDDAQEIADRRYRQFRKTAPAGRPKGAKRAAVAAGRLQLVGGQAVR